MATITAAAVARYIGSDSRVAGLLYYAQAWHLAIYHRPLFDEPIAAGEDGPIVRLTDESGTLDAAAKIHVDRVLARYAAFSAAQLAQLICSEPPYIVARQRMLLDGSLRIREEDMMLFYRYSSRDIITRAAIGLCRAASAVAAFGFDSYLANH